MRSACDAKSKKRQLKPEFAAFRCSKISGVVPPFRLKIRMIEMIAGKFVSITRYSEPVRITTRSQGGKGAKDRACDRDTRY